MEGYIRSLSNGWKHIFKRSVRPGGKIPLEELYDTYGKKYKLKNSEDFITWLKEVKLKGVSDSWEVITLDDITPKDLSSEGVKKSKALAKANSNVVTTINHKEMTVEDVVALPVRKAREVVPKIMDLKLLKYALQEAKPRANKDSLCRILDKRIQEVSIAR